jgi:2,4-dienoyl-CoA reductase-like NADH-dependent reductase (Old Yellow Enzyme family)
LTDILPEIRSRTAESFSVAVRMGAYMPTLDDGIETAKLFEKAGVDLLDITYGVKMPSGPTPDDFPFSPVTYSGRLIKQAVGIPVIGVYGLRTGEQVRMLIARGYADFAGIGKGMLADLYFADHVIWGLPMNSCQACKRCRWYTDHTKCPARRAAAS